LFSNKRSLARHYRFTARLGSLAFGRILALLGSLLVAGERRGLGLFTLVPRIAAIAGTRRQAGVLGQDLGGLFPCTLWLPAGVEFLRRALW
jgi:hypothetical protein